MRHVLYSLFLEDCLEKLDTKYQNVIKDEMDDLFLYANIIEFPIYYKPFSRKNNPDYKIFEKLHTQKHLDVIEYIKTQIIEDNYNPKSLLFLYGFISHIVFDFYLESYISNILTINKIKKTTKNYSMVSANIEANFYYERTNKKIKKFKDNSLQINEETYSLINDILKNIYYNSMGIKVYKISFNNFKKYSKKAKNNPLKIKSLIYKILDSFSKQKKYAISSIFKTNKIDKKIDYLNKNKAAWYLNGDIKLELSFYELYEKAMYESLNIINEINEQIFYKKKPKNIVAMLLNNITKIQ